MPSDSAPAKAQLELLERQRIILILGGIPFCILSFTLIILVFLGVLPFVPAYVGFAFVLGVLSLLIILAMNRIRRQAKDILILQSVQSIPNTTDIEYLSHLNRRSPQVQELQNIFKQYNTKRNLDTIDDYLRFQYKHCSVELIDGSLSYTVGSGKNSRKHTDYYLTLKTVFPDTVHGITSVVNTDFWNSSWKFCLPESISTESLDLNKHFTIRATNQVSARMHLQPNIMANILDLYEHRHYQNIVYFFEDSSLTVIMQETKASFEPSMLRSLTSPHQLSGITQDIERCLHIFDTMWLDLRARKN